MPLNCVLANTPSSPFNHNQQFLPVFKPEKQAFGNGALFALVVKDMLQAGFSTLGGIDLLVYSDVHL